MGRYFFSITDGARIVRDRIGTELAGLSDVQNEAIEFGLKVIKHRFSYGIMDQSVCSIRVTNEIGRVLTTIPLGTIKRLSRHAQPTIRGRG
jgi:hypothetical protein